jgi:hypothetical protein
LLRCKEEEGGKEKEERERGGRIVSRGILVFT